MSTSTQMQTQFEGLPLAMPPAQSEQGTRSNFLPVRPLRRWLRDYVIRVGGIGNAAIALHVHERRLWGILRQQEWVTINVADMILIAAGEPHTFVMLYPLDAADPSENLPEGAKPEASGPTSCDRWCPACREAVKTNYTVRCPECRRPTRALRRPLGARSGNLSEREATGDTRGIVGDEVSR